MDGLHGYPLWGTSMGFLTLVPPESEGDKTAQKGVLTGATLLGRCGRNWILSRVLSSPLAAARLHYLTLIPSPSPSLSMTS